MVESPPLTPVKKPDADVIVPTAVLELLHIPPGVVLANMIVSPEQTVAVPVIAAGVSVTVSILVTVHPP